MYSSSDLFSECRGQSGKWNTGYHHVRSRKTAALQLRADRTCATVHYTETRIVNVLEVIYKLQSAFDHQKTGIRTHRVQKGPGNPTGAGAKLYDDAG